MPTDWDVDPDKRKNVQWSAKLGSQAYGGPIVAGGKVFVGTNNERPRNPRDARKTPDGKVEPIDKGVLMCFDEATGKFLWQRVHDKLPPAASTTGRRRASAPPRSSRATGSTTSATAARSSASTPNGLADGNQGVPGREVQGPDRRRRRSGELRHDARN